MPAQRMNTIQHETSDPTSFAAGEGLTVSVVIPCLNEEQTIEECVRRAREVIKTHGIPGQIIVADNDSEAASARLAADAGAIVVHEPQRGDGSAYMAGFAVARGRFIVMADVDFPHDFCVILMF